MNKAPKVKNKVLQIRCTQAFLDDVDELREALGMNRTELIEYLIRYLPTLAK